MGSAKLRTHIAKREQHQIGKYKVTLMYDENGKIIGALIEGPRMTRPVYIAATEKTKLKLPKQVAKFLQKHGFSIELSSH
ncbi:MAG TPA: hypothetical protein EYH08_03195 [Pyrodictium sp.]|nr:hypothetical protein [Pyrodictium sp.]